MFHTEDGYKKICQLLGYTFNNKVLLLQAITRKSALNEGREEKKIGHNETFATLGDGLLRTVIDDILMEINPDYAKGALSPNRDKLVNNAKLAEISRNCKLEQFLIMGRGEEHASKGKGNTTIMASTLEALIGAIFLDSGRDYHLVKKFIIQKWGFTQHYTDSFINAIANNDAPQVTYFLKCGADPNQVLTLIYPPGNKINADIIFIPFECTKDEPFDIPSFPLFEAVTKNNIAMAAALIKYGASLNQYNLVGQTALYQAAYHGHVEMADLLIRHGAKFIEEKLSGFTPLHIAVFAGKTQMTKFLLDKGAEISKKDFSGESPLHVAASQGHTEIAAYLLDKGAQVDIKSVNIKKYDLMETPLHQAASKGHIEVIKLLIRHGANVNERDQEGQTALHKAVAGKHLLAVKEILKSDAQTDITDKAGKQAQDLTNDGEIREAFSCVKDWYLFNAVKNKDLEAVNHWLDRGANPNTLHEFSYEISCPLSFGKGRPLMWFESCLSVKISTPLDLAIRRLEELHTDTLRIVKTLLEHGANPNITGSFTNPLLHETIVYYFKGFRNYPDYKKVFTELTKLLCQHGADTTMRSSVHQNEYGFTPLELAIGSADYEKVCVLLSYGADPNLKDADGQTALHLAAIFADVYVKQSNNYGFFANSDIDYRQVFSDIIYYLLAYGADPRAVDNKGNKPAALVNHYLFKNLLAVKDARTYADKKHSVPKLF
jgi:ankyrin repeat protein